jgi:hypothetical protein
MPFELPVVSVASTAPSRRLGGHGDLGELFGSLLDRGATGRERQADTAELALVGVAPVRAGLYDVLANESRCSRAIFQYGMPSAVLRS